MIDCSLPAEGAQTSEDAEAKAEMLMLSKTSPEHPPSCGGLCVPTSPLWSRGCLHRWGNKSKPSQSFFHEPAVGVSCQN